jgi:hypothetical protein
MVELTQAPPPVIGGAPGAIQTDVSVFQLPFHEAIILCSSPGVMYACQFFAAVALSTGTNAVSFVWLTVYFVSVLVSVLQAANTAKPMSKRFTFFICSILMRV